MQDEPTKKTLDIRWEIRRCSTCDSRFSRDAVFCPYDGTRLDVGKVDPLSDRLVATTVDGRYEILGVLGEGGMGRVYRVRHLALGRVFALKALRSDFAHDEDLAARFIHEARATAAVRHPNVVQINDFGHLPDGSPYFVMELLLGETLGEVIKSGGPMPAGRAVRIVKQIAGGLEAAHVAGVVHRDLKPDNVFLVGAVGGGGGGPESADRGRARAILSDNPDVRVVDFGAAKIVGSARTTRAGIVFGTPHYMSPEQASGEPVDHRADIYALGIIMYEMFTGKVPFEADTYMGVLTQHMFVQPVPPSQVAGAAKELGALEEITLVCLAKKPDDRFGSMQELVEAIEGVVRVRDGVTEVASKLPPGADGGGATVPYRMADELEPPTLEEVRVAIDGAPRVPIDTRWRLFAVAVGALVVLGGGVLWARARVAPSPPAPAAAAVTAAASLPSTIPPLDSVSALVPSAVPVAPAEATGSPAQVASTPLVPLRPSPRRARPRSTAPLDDIGDPFSPTPRPATR